MKHCRAALHPPIFVENEAKATAAIERNAEKLGATSQIRIVIGSALSLPPSDPFDLILADPPYASGSGILALAAIAEAGWLAPGGWVSVETSCGDAVEPAGLKLAVAKDVGRARLTLLHHP